ncbi:MAG TPA: sulfate adenylyltransferase subunit CysN [Bryobacteraceae bacterium]|jgi:sulfate adenylyltransferase large subunit
MSAATLLSVDQSFDRFLQQEQTKGLLRFTTAGSVDDGKSTLIGRLLYDSQSVFDDQLESVTKASVGRNAGPIDFSLLTDGLRAEREQGITIDVAYRYFATPRRKFIIADTPGHEQYTRNMVTGASTADLAVILVDARKGLLPQSRRHASVAALLGIKHLAVAVNKMDMVGYDQTVFDEIEASFRKFLTRFEDIEARFIPVSALVGDNVVLPGSRMRWFKGPTLLNFLETVEVETRSQHARFRFPVQRVVRPDQEFRGYAGTVASGRIRVGAPVTIMPSGRSTTIESISTFDGELDEASAGQAITLTLADEIDIIRGDVIVASDDLPHVGSSIRATLVWLHQEPGREAKRYRLKHTTRQEWSSIVRIQHAVNINTQQHEPVHSLEMNAIGVADIETARPLCFDPYQENRVTGSFILVDPATNATVAAGMISGPNSSAATVPLSVEDEVAWRIEDGSLIVSLPGTVRAARSGIASDPETLEALLSLLNRLDVL